MFFAAFAIKGFVLAAAKKPLTAKFAKKIHEGR